MWNHPDGADNITDAQLDLLAKLNEAHGNITFLHELAEPVNLGVSFPKKKKRPGIFRRFWRVLIYKFGLAAAGDKESEGATNPTTPAGCVGPV